MNPSEIDSKALIKEENRQVLKLSDGTLSLKEIKTNYLTLSSFINWIMKLEQYKTLKTIVFNQSVYDLFLSLFSHLFIKNKYIQSKFN